MSRGPSIRDRDRAALAREARSPSALLRYTPRLTHRLERDPTLNHPTDKQRQTETTRILLGARSKSRPEREESREQLHALLDEELRGVAERATRSARADHTVVPATLIHELYTRLIDQSRVDWSDRARFFQIAARAMRQLVIDQARLHRAAKRGGAWRRIAIDQEVIVPGINTFDLVVLGDAFEKLAKRDPRTVAVTELRLFAGLTPAEIAYVLGVSERTAEADWSFARRWLKKEIGNA